MTLNSSSETRKKIELVDIREIQYVKEKSKTSAKLSQGASRYVCSGFPCNTE